MKKLTRESLEAIQILDELIRKHSKEDRQVTKALKHLQKSIVREQRYLDKLALFLLKIDEDRESKEESLLRDVDDKFAIAHDLIPTKSELSRIKELLISKKSTSRRVWDELKRLALSYF